ncbi:hypothetical protein GCM10009846_22420 [Agrococcus versicolor]|uniref:Uncharacterized protein n=1 Tax=Agrococcus versicolor TaxID=501482 RepID=A0ABP5MJV2_9MICO
MRERVEVELARADDDEQLVGRDHARGHLAAVVAGDLAQILDLLEKARKMMPPGQPTS